MPFHYELNKNHCKNADQHRCLANASGGKCPLTATVRTMGGDPCAGTYKYMRVCTYCEPDGGSPISTTQPPITTTKPAKPSKSFCH